MSSTVDPHPLSGQEYTAIQESDRFQQLRRKQRSFIFPVTVLFLAWYFLYVLLAAYAHDFMSTSVFGNVNIGIILGLLQFVSTFAITMLYVRFADRHLDPVAEEIRHEIEGVR